jgi:hypothetical protein
MQRVFAGRACKLSSLGIAILAGSACCAVAVRDTPKAQAAKATIRSFAQGKEGNCSSIGFIKAVIHSGFGVFKEWRVMPGGGVRAQNHAGRAFEVSKSEVDLASSRSRFVVEKAVSGSDDALQRANEVFAVLAKACQNSCEANDGLCPYGTLGRCSYEGAVGQLADALYFAAPPDLLGLRQGEDWNRVRGWKVRKWFAVTRFVRGGGSCVVATRGHTFFVSEGWADWYGRPVPFGSKVGSLLALRAADAYCLGADVATVEFSGESTPPPETTLPKL